MYFNAPVHTINEKISQEVVRKSSVPKENAGKCATEKSRRSHGHLWKIIYKSIQFANFCRIKIKNLVGTVVKSYYKFVKKQNNCVLGRWYYFIWKKCCFYILKMLKYIQYITYKNSSIFNFSKVNYWMPHSRFLQI